MKIDVVSLRKRMSEKHGDESLRALESLSEALNSLESGDREVAELFLMTGSNTTSARILGTSEANFRNRRSKVEGEISSFMLRNGITLTAALGALEIASLSCSEGTNPAARDQTEFPRGPGQTRCRRRRISCLCFSIPFMFTVGERTKNTEPPAMTQKHNRKSPIIATAFSWGEGEEHVVIDKNGKILFRPGCDRIDIYDEYYIIGRTVYWNQDQPGVLGGKRTRVYEFEVYDKKFTSVYMGATGFRPCGNGVIQIRTKEGK